MVFSLTLGKHHATTGLLAHLHFPPPPLLETATYGVAHTGLELHNPPASVSRTAGFTGLYHHTQCFLAILDVLFILSGLE